MGERIGDAPVQHTVETGRKFRAKRLLDGNQAERNRASRRFLPPGSEIPDQLQSIVTVGEAPLVDQDA